MREVLIIWSGRGDGTSGSFVRPLPVGVVLLLEFDRAEVAEPLPPKPVVSAAPTSPSRAIRTGSVPSVLDREPGRVVGGRDLHHGQACLCH